MIIHASIPADEPERVARVMAELWRGESMPFPVFEGAYIAISNAGDGAEIEVTPRSLDLVPGREEVEAKANPQAQPHCTVHLALDTPLDEAAVMAIAKREGWLARRCDRAGCFEVIELWLENKFLVEILTAEMRRRYLEFMTPANFRAFLEKAA